MTASSASAAMALALVTSSSGSATLTGNRLGSLPQLSRTPATPSQTSTESWRTKPHPKEGDDVTDRCFPSFLFYLPLSIAHHTALIYLLSSCRFSLLPHLSISFLSSPLLPSNRLSSVLLSPFLFLFHSFCLTHPSLVRYPLFSLSLDEPSLFVCVVRQGEHSLCIHTARICIVHTLNTDSRSLFSSCVWSRQVHTLFRRVLFPFPFRL